ncbi:MAG TPA: isoleucine--tRNA ligase [Candidatus Limnocylindrales bacterium]|nr:isoleucine--tRNA ligase [Candidatus Limnocylindrales bacterium]
MRFAEVSTQVKFPALEEEVLRFWREHKIFERSVEQREGAPPFVFYEGPPTANGLPGIHHVLARAMKDLFPRYKTMKGFLVERKGGWDTHGLAVEIEVEKKLKLSGKPDIEKFGIEEFNRLCRQSVFEYIDEWAQFTERMGFWVDMEHAYRTYDSTYIESVWWILKQLWDRQLLYQGFKVVPYCPRDMTPLSSHELAQGYRDNIEDPSVYVKFELEDEPKTYFLAWTTTPWTLPGNVALAVGLDIPYVRVRQGDERYILARARLSVLQGEYEVEADVDPKTLLGRRYQPLYRYLIPDKPAFFVVDADFVSVEDGTGIVHTAAAYGVDDLDLCLKKGIPVRHVVDLNGRFMKEVEPFAGIFVKKADPLIIDDLGKRGLLYRAETIRHTYPFCWRCGTPLLYYALTSWFARTTAVKANLLRNNEAINWVPPYIKTGRMGNWLETLVDWSLSRWRYWGTPLPIWICETCQAQRCVGSVEELGLTLDADLHRPYIDRVTLPCACGGQMRRVTDVIDVWFDSGSMPVAQFHYPFENREVFQARFPADFISEAVDQTRGWFFSLLAISTMLFDQPAYKNVVTYHHVLDKHGKEMHKSLGNTVDPMGIMAQYGADATRWYFYSSVTVGNEYRFDPESVRDIVRGFLLTLWNVYAFFANYARLEGFDPDKPAIPVRERPTLDRWLLSELSQMVADVERALEAYDPYAASRRIEGFVVEDLSKWYVRRSRRRFWKSTSDRDSLAGYQTLYQAILTVVSVLAPFAPFVTEAIYRNLNAGRPGQPESVHLGDWPARDAAAVDPHLQAEMKRLRRLTETALAARNAAAIKIRQPLNAMTVADRPLDRELESILLEELNVKQVRYEGEGGGVVLDTVVTPELRLEGLARDLVRGIQELRKQSGFAVEDRIAIAYDGDGLMAQALERWRDYIAAETLAVEVTRGAGVAGGFEKTFSADGESLRISIRKAAAR